MFSDSIGSEGYSNGREYVLVESKENIGDFVRVDRGVCDNIFEVEVGEVVDERISCV